MHAPNCFLRFLVLQAFHTGYGQVDARISSRKDNRIDNKKGWIKICIRKNCPSITE